MALEHPQRLVAQRSASFQDSLDDYASPTSLGEDSLGSRIASHMAAVGDFGTAEVPIPGCFLKLRRHLQTLMAGYEEEEAAAKRRHRTARILRKCNSAKPGEWVLAPQNQTTHHFILVPRSCPVTSFCPP